MASSMSPVLYPGLRTLLLVINPMAEGVGVIGGGFVGEFATFLRLFGVVGGGAIETVAPSCVVSSCAIAFVAASSVGFDFLARFFGGAAASAIWTLGSSVLG